MALFTMHVKPYNIYSTIYKYNNDDMNDISVQPNISHTRCSLSCHTLVSDQYYTHLCTQLHIYYMMVFTAAFVLMSIYLIDILILKMF